MERKAAKAAFFFSFQYIPLSKNATIVSVFDQLLTVSVGGWYNFQDFQKGGEQ
jgi:hypothetical protein